jgi:hypothetical protein
MPVSVGHDYNYNEAVPASFTVTASNPSSTILRLTITDTGYALKSTKMKRAVLCDAITQFLAAESADLTTNGDGALVTAGAEAFRPGDGFADWNFNYRGLYAQVTLTATTNINTSATYTATSPFAVVV